MDNRITTGSILLICIAFAAALSMQFSSRADDADAQKTEKPADAKPAEVIVRLQDVKMDFKPLEKWGRKRYAVTMLDLDGDFVDGKSPDCGHMTFTTNLKDGNITYDDEGHIRVGEFDNDPWIFDWRAEGKLNSLLSVTSLDYNYAGQKMIARFTDGRAEIKRTKKGESTTAQKPWPASTVMEFAVVRLVTLLPTEAGRTYLIEQYFDRPDVSMEPDGLRTLRCKGPDADFGPKDAPWIRYEQYYKDPEKDNRDTLEIIYWVSKGRTLERFYHQQQNFVFTLDRKPAAGNKD